MRAGYVPPRRYSASQDRGVVSTPSPMITFVVALGILLFELGFFMPWLTLRPSIMLEAIGESVGLIFGDGMGIFDKIAENLVIHLSGWDLATGVTMEDLLPEGPFGLMMRASFQDPQMLDLLSQNVLPPLVWLLPLPLLALGNLLFLLMSRTGRGKGFVLVSGLASLLGLLVYLVFVSGMRKSLVQQMSQDIEWQFLGMLIEIRVGSGVWISLLGTFLWLGGIVGYLSTSPRVPKSPAVFPSRSSFLPHASSRHLDKARFERRRGSRRKSRRIGKFTPWK